MSNEKSDKSKRFYVEFKHFNINRTAWKVNEAEVDHFAKLFLLHHADLKPQNLIVTEGLHDADVIFDMTEGQVVSHVVLAPAAKQSKSKLEIAPGFKLHGWLSSMCPRTFKENVLDECLAEGTRMYQDMLAAGDSKGARRVRWAMRVWMLRAVFGGFVTGAFMLLGRFRKTSD